MVKKIIRWDELYGLEHEKRMFLQRIDKGCLGKNYLFVGPEGIGKTALAKLIAVTVNCSDAHKPCYTCPDCKRLIKTVIEDEKDTEEVKFFNGSTPVDDNPHLAEEISAAINEIGMLPPNKRRVVIVDECDRMNRKFQQALNKDMENIPDNVTVILLANLLSDLLPAFLSRFVVINFREPSRKEVVSLLRKEVAHQHIRLQNPDAILNLIAETCNDRPRAALHKLEQFIPGEEVTWEEAKAQTGYLALDKVIPLLSALKSNGSRLVGIKAARELDLNEQGHLQLIDIATEAMALAGGGLTTKYGPTDSVLLAQAVEGVSPDTLCRFITFLANLKRCTAQGVIAAFLNAHQNKEGIGTPKRNVLQSEREYMAEHGSLNLKEKAATAKGQLGGGVNKLPSLSELKKNGQTIK